jgi:hypothetical protein
MPGVEHVPVTWERPSWITNMDGKMKPVLIVDHVMQGWLTTMVNYALQRGPSLRKVTPHFNIGREGRTVQIESIFTPGIHASALNIPTAKRVLARVQMLYGTSFYSVGIEHEGFSAPLAGVTDAGAGKDALWTRANPWPEAMVQASIRAHRWVLDQCPEMGGASRESIIGHYEVDARNRAGDPASAAERDVWPVERIIAALAPQASAGGVLSPVLSAADISQVWLAWARENDPSLASVLAPVPTRITRLPVSGGRRRYEVSLPL